MARFAWLVPRLLHGSGGHRTILQHAHALQERGHHVDIYLEGTPADWRSARELVFNMFDFHFDHARFGWDNILSADAVVATIWYSARLVRDLPFSCVKLYFVQDWEAYFNPVGDTYLLAENSYSYGLVPITIGRWLAARLGKEEGIPAYFYDFGANHQVYKQVHAVRRELSVCFIFQPEKPRRCARIGIEALGILKFRMPDVTIYIYGSPPCEKGSIWFDHHHLGLLTPQACGELYNRCQVGLCISSTNPSRIPFEMMATGLPVVDIWRDNTLYDFPDDAMILSRSTPEAIADAMIRILQDPSLAARMSSAGTRFMRHRSLVQETEHFCRAAEHVLAGGRPVFPRLQKLYKAPPHEMSTALGVLPDSILMRLSKPPNAGFHRLPPFLQRLLSKLWNCIQRHLNGI
jgi:glycosyltransferase involved in cell wall biosynthesis